MYYRAILNRHIGCTDITTYQLLDCIYTQYIGDHRKMSGESRKSRADNTYGKRPDTRNNSARLTCAEVVNNGTCPIYADITRNVIEFKKVKRKLNKKAWI